MQALYAQLAVGTEVEYQEEGPNTVLRAVVTQLQPLCMWHAEVVEIEVREELAFLVRLRGATPTLNVANGVLRGLPPLPYRTWLNLWWIRKIKLPGGSCFGHV